MSNRLENLHPFFGRDFGKSRGIAVLALLLLLFAGCDSGNTTEPPGTVARLVIAPAADTIETPIHYSTYPVSPDSLTHLVATVYDEDGREIPNAPVEWTSSDTMTVRVDSTGLALAVCCQGNTFRTATVTATSGGAQTQAEISVFPGIYELIHNVPGQLVVGREVDLKASFSLYGSGAPNVYQILVDAPADFTSSDTSILSIDSEGVATALSAGSVVVSVGGLAHRSEDVEVQIAGSGYKVESVADLGVAGFKIVDLNNEGQLLVQGEDGVYLREADGTLLRAGPLTRAFDLNNLGEVVGWIGGDANTRELAVWSVEDLRTIEHDRSCAPYTDPFALSDAGVVGLIGCNRVTIYDGDSTQMIPRIWSSAGAIDSNGAIAGGLLPPFPKAVVYQNGEFTEITGGRGGADATALNEDGQVVGYFDAFFTYGFVYRFGEDEPTRLDSLGGDATFAYDINLGGDIVGRSKDADDEFHGIIVRNGKTFSLNPLLLTEGWTILDAREINDAGFILASAEDTAGVVQQVLLTPSAVMP